MKAAGTRKRALRQRSLTGDQPILDLCRGFRWQARETAHDNLRLGKVATQGLHQADRLHVKAADHG